MSAKKNSTLITHDSKGNLTGSKSLGGKTDIPTAKSWLLADLRQTKKKEKDFAAFVEAKRIYDLLNESYASTSKAYLISSSGKNPLIELAKLRLGQVLDQTLKDLKLARKVLDKTMMVTVQYEVAKLQVGDVATLVYVNNDTSGERNDLNDFDAFVDEALLAELKTGLIPSQDEDFPHPWKLISVEIKK